MLKGILNIIFLGAVTDLCAVSYATLPLTEDFESSSPSLSSYWTTSFDNSTSGRLESRALIGSYPIFATTNSQKGSGYNATLTTPSGNGLVTYNTSFFSSYSFNDDASENSTNYYRLKQVDYDGKFEFSKVVELINPAFVQAVNVYPNPSSDGKVTLTSNAFKSNTYNVYDMNGKLVETHVVSTNNYTLYLNPSSSLYYISYFDGAALHTIKVAVY